MAERDKIDKWNRMLKFCDLPKNSEHLTLDSFVVRTGTEEAYRWAVSLAADKEEIKWLILLGHVDQGKTHLAIGIARRWLERGIPAKYKFVPILLDDLRQGYQPEARISYDDEFNILKSVPLLVIDDLGAESKTIWAQEKLDTIVDYRYANALPLVVTSQLSVKQLFERSERIASRLLRFRLGKVIVMSAGEYRLWKGESCGEN